MSYFRDSSCSHMLRWRLALAGLCFAAPLVVNAQMLVNPSVDELIAQLQRRDPNDGSRGSFVRTSRPSTDNLCPGATVDPARTQATASGSRDLVVVPYAGNGAPSVALDVRFGTGSDRLSAEDRKLLDSLAKALNDPRLESARFALAGHTDATGDDKVNLELSCARAIAARLYLISKGVSASRLAGYGFGSQKPIEATNADSATNRRVEIRRAPDVP